MLHIELDRRMPRHRRAFVACLLAVSCLGWTLGCSSASMLATTTAGIESLSWLTGFWVEERGAQRTEESWSAQEPGALIGVNRVYQGDELVFYEYLRIERNADGSIVYQARPLGREPTPFQLVESSEQRAVFENPEHDFPRRILYWIDGQGALQARAVGEAHGETQAEAWSLQPGTTAPAALQ